MKSKALWMISGNGGYAAFQLLNMVVISKTLGVEELGVFSLGLALSAPIMLFSNFGTRILWITGVNHGMSFRLFRNARIISSLAGLLICLVFLAIYTQMSAHLPIMSLIAMSKVIENNADIYYADFHKTSNQKLVCTSLLVRGLFGVTGVIIGCVIFDSLLVAALLYFLTWGTAHLLTEHILTRTAVNMGSDQNTLSKKQWIWLAKQGTPLAISMFLVNFNMNIPRVILENQHGLAAIGIFSALYFFIQTGTVVVNSIGQVVLPILSSMFDKGETKKHLFITLKTFGVIFAFSLSGAVFSYFFGKYFLNLLFSKEISSYSSLLCLFFLLSPAQYLITIMSQVIASTKNNISLMWCQLVMLVTVLILSFVFIPSNGIKGTYWATAIASGIVFLIYIFSYLRAIKIGNE
ncbi:MAG: oligosaccharide flippase family protein [Paraglaciecola sp.]|uniref:lipopolysaccharide biosynthesis protein n=1 Tax=Paraglaciecola sp. TaxID=1920173 RepID=UPI0032981CB2